MIRVYCGEEQENIVVRVEGHANYAPQGYDIVCSAVSSLYYTLCKSIVLLTDDEVKGDIEECAFQIIKPSEKSKTLVNIFMIGCRLISEEYPAHVEIQNNSFK